MVYRYIEYIPHVYGFYISVQGYKGLVNLGYIGTSDILQVYGRSYMVLIRIINFVMGKLLLGKCKDVATI